MKEGILISNEFGKHVQTPDTFKLSMIGRDLVSLKAAACDD